MKNTQYRQFINTLPVDTKTIIEYSISVFKDLENKKLVVSEKDDSNFTKFTPLTETDKAFLAIFISLLTVNSSAKEFMNANNVNRDTLLEFLENANDHFILPIGMKQLPEEEKEKTYSSKFYFLKTLLHDENLETERLSPEVLTYLILNNNKISSVIDKFYSQTYKGITSSSEHRSFIELSKEFSIHEKNNREKEESKPNKKIARNGLIDEIGVNISKKRNLPKAIGRNNEMRNIQIALKTPSKKGVILVGEAGVGKRAIVEGLARDIRDGNVPEGLKDKEIIEIDLASLVAGTSYRGQFEERVKTILNEAKEDPNIILFIDGIHNGINGSEEESKLDFVSMLSGYLARGEISVIATTNKDAFVNIFLPNENISARLWKISVEEPTPEVVEEILYSSIDEISQITGVRFPEDTDRREFMIKSIVDITSKEKRGYFASGNNPDLARGILERTFAIASINEHSEVEEIDLVEAIQTDETLSKDAREKQANRIRQSIPKKNDDGQKSNIISIQLLKTRK